MKLISILINVEVPENENPEIVDAQMDYSFTFKGQKLETHFIESEIKDIDSI